MIRQWLEDNPEDRRAAKGSIRKSNRTDNESAKMATSKGVIQGYTGVAAVDAKCQVIVEAQAHGTGSEQELLLPVVDSFRDLIEKDSILTADAGYHSEQSLKRLVERGMEALIADNAMRQRDQRFADQAKHKDKPDPLWDKTSTAMKTRLFGPKDFTHDEESKTCICPARESLYQNGAIGVCDSRHRGGEDHRGQARVRAVSAQRTMPAPC